MLLFAVSAIGCCIGGIRAGIGSLRISKLSNILYKYQNKMHGGTRESAGSRKTKGTLYALHVIYVFGGGLVHET